MSTMMTMEEKTKETNMATLRKRNGHLQIQVFEDGKGLWANINGHIIRGSNVFLLDTNLDTVLPTWLGRDLRFKGRKNAIEQ